MSNERLGLNGMSPENKQFYDRQLLAYAVPNFVFMNYGLKRGIPGRGGNSIEWRRLEYITTSTTALTEGTPPSVTNVTFTAIAATVQQYGQFARHSDVLAAQGFDPVITEMVEHFGVSMKDALDQVVRNVVVGGTTVQYASTATSRGDVGSGDRLTLAEIREAVGTLKRNNAKPIVDGKFILITHTDSIEDLFADSDLQQIFLDAAARGGGNPLMTGEIGDVAGVRVIHTTNARIFSSNGLSGADVYATMILGQQGYGVSDWDALSARTFIKPIGSAGALDPLDQFGTVGWKAAIAAARLNENWMVRIEHTTSQSNAA